MNLQLNFFWGLTAVYAPSLTRGPAGNRTTTGNLSATSRMPRYQLSHEHDYELATEQEGKKSAGRDLQFLQVTDSYCAACGS